MALFPAWVRESGPEKNLERQDQGGLWSPSHPDPALAPLQQTRQNGAADAQISMVYCSVLPQPAPWTHTSWVFSTGLQSFLRASARAGSLFSSEVTLRLMSLQAQ